MRSAAGAGAFLLLTYSCTGQLCFYLLVAYDNTGLVVLQRHTKHNRISEEYKT